MFDVWRRLKVAAAERVGRDLLEYVAVNPEDNIPRIFDIGMALAREPRHKQMIASLRQLYQADPVYQEAIRRLLGSTSVRFRQRFLVALIFNAVLLGIPEQQRNTEELGVQIPFTVLIDPTESCNLRCEGCWAGEYQAQTLPEEVMNRVIEEAKDLGIYFIVLSGGEPFLYKPLLDLVERHHEVAFMAYTNGTLIDEEVAARLGGDLGNLTPAISLEGNREFTDARRGPGVFDQVIEAMDRLRRHGVFFGFSVTVTRHNAYHLFSDAFIDLMLSKGASYGWSFHYVPVGRNPSLDLMVTPGQRAWLAERIPDLRRKKGFLLADFWNDGELTGGCIAGGRRYFHITAGGQVEPCAFAHFTMDNIMEKSLKEVLSSPLFQAYQARQPFDDNLLRPCPIIDHPGMLREIVNSCGASSTHEGAEQILKETLAEDLDKRAEKWGKASEAVWRRRQAACQPDSFSWQDTQKKSS